jgi:hypothetical protein
VYLRGGALSDEKPIISRATIRAAWTAHDWEPFLTAGVPTLAFAAILVLLVWWDHEIKPNVVLVALIPLLIWLLAAGKLSKFKAFGVELETVITQVSRETISAGDEGSSPIEYQKVVAASKEGLMQIDEIIRNRTPALKFYIHKENFYDSGMIDVYFQRLGEHAFFRWIVFVRKDRDNNEVFKGLAPASSIRRPEYQQFIGKLERNELDDIPGLVGADQAVRETAKKSEVIEKFPTVEADDLPVVNTVREFVGVINRRKLHSNLLASIFRAAKPARS